MVETVLPIYGGYYVNRSLPVSNQECSNLYVQKVQSGLSEFALFGTPGLSQLVTVGGRKLANRGSHEMAGVPYFVQGGFLYSLDRTVTGTTESFSYTLLGNITGTGRVSMADNGTQLCIVVPGSPSVGYIYDTTNGLQTITDADFTANGNPQYVVYIDGYFVFSTDSKKFIASALNDGLDYNALDFGSAEADPDDIVAPIVHNNQLFIGGTQTIEAFQNIGGADFPFQRVQGFVMDTGLDAPLSIVNAHNTFYCIGGDETETPGVLAFEGSSMVKVSTDAIDILLEDLTPEQLSQVYGFAYTENGAQFVGWILPTTCVVYERNTGLWHQRKSQVTDINGTTNTRWRVQSLVSAYNRILVADSEDGRIGEMSLDYYDEYGEEIIRSVSTLPFSNQSKPISFPYLELTLESGVGTYTLDPKVTLERSLDGKNWTAPRIRSFGKLGEYERRAVWRRNGRAARFEAFRFTISDPVKVVISKLEADVV